MFRLKITAQAKKELKRIKYTYHQAVYAALSEIREDPYSGKPLSREFAGKFSYRVGVYRIIYTVNKKDKTIYIISAGHRAIIYTK